LVSAAESLENFFRLSGDFSEEYLGILGLILGDFCWEILFFWRVCVKEKEEGRRWGGWRV
jgi:hypothetical protein